MHRKATALNVAAAMISFCTVGSALAGNPFEDLANGANDVIHNNPVSDWVNDRANEIPVPGLPGATVKSFFDSFIAAGGNPQDFPGVLLASSIRGSRDRARRSCNAIPASIRWELAPYFEADLLNSVCFSTDWGAAQNNTVQQLLLGNDAASAVTLIDTIVFADGRYVGNVHLWEHELSHVAQYRRMGVEGFSNRYTVASWTLENEAEDGANHIDAARTAQLQRANWQPQATAATWQPPTVLYTHCATPAGNSGEMAGGYPGTSCWIQTPWGPVWGTVVGSYR